MKYYTKEVVILNSHGTETTVTYIIKARTLKGAKKKIDKLMITDNDAVVRQSHIKLLGEQDMQFKKDYTSLEAYSIFSKLEKKTDNLTNDLILKHFPNRTLTKATKEQDINEATDVVLTDELTGKTIAVAKRVRNYEAYLYFRNEFTFRKEELRKFLEGKCDYVFYMFLNEDDTQIIYYYFIDLDMFRFQYDPDRYYTRMNVDGTTFCCFKYYNWLAVTPYKLAVDGTYLKDIE